MPKKSELIQNKLREIYGYCDIKALRAILALDEQKPEKPDTPFKEDLRRLLEYNADERKHWETYGGENHIYLTMQRLEKVLDFSDAVENVGKVWVVLGLMGGLPAEDPKIFFHEDEAHEASKSMDEELGIVRDADGHYDSDNDSYLYEIEIGENRGDNA